MPNHIRLIKTHAEAQAEQGDIMYPNTEEEYDRMSGNFKKNTRLTIWKWKMFPGIDLEMPLGSKILCVQTQGTDVQLWAMVDPSKEKEKRSFVAYGTGHKLPQNPGCYVGTCQLEHLVIHVFETILLEGNVGYSIAG